MKYEVIRHLTLDGIAHEIGSEIELAEEIADAIPGALRAIPLPHSIEDALAEMGLEPEVIPPPPPGMPEPPADEPKAKTRKAAKTADKD